MTDRLLVGVLGNHNSGKSHTWNTLFGRTVKRGKYPHDLELLPCEFVKAFLVSGSFEERGEYAGDILGNQDCRIVLCSMQYTNDVHTTLDYLIGQDFFFLHPVAQSWLQRFGRDMGPTGPCKQGCFGVVGVFYPQR